MKTTDILMIGAGRIGDLHARNIVSRIPDLNLCGVAEPFPRPEFRDWCASLDIPLFTDPVKAVSETGAAAVLIAAPTDRHEPLAVAAAAAGKHIFCEKPLAADIPAARRIETAAGKAGVVLQIGFNRRFDRNFAALQRTARSGSLGRIEMIRVTSRDPGPPPMEYIRRSGGIFMDMTIHDFDMVRYLADADFTSVYVNGAVLVDPEIGKADDIDSAVITFRLTNGAIGVIENSRRAVYGYDQRAELLGSDGAAGITNEYPDTLTISDSESVHRSKPLHFFLERYADSFVDELRTFARIIKGESPPPMQNPAAGSGRDGIEAMRVAQACRLSLHEKREVLLEEIE